jgi:hypothetical protein
VVGVEGCLGESDGAGVQCVAGEEVGKASGDGAVDGAPLGNGTEWETGFGLPVSIRMSSDKEHCRRAAVIQGSFRQPIAPWQVVGPAREANRSCKP